MASLAKHKKTGENDAQEMPSTVRKHWSSSEDVKLLIEVAKARPWDLAHTKRGECWAEVNKSTADAIGRPLAPDASSKRFKVLHDAFVKEQLADLRSSGVLPVHVHKYFSNRR